MTPDPCHVTPFLRPGVTIEPAAAAPSSNVGGLRAGTAATASADVCDYCGSPHLEWRKCKLVCVSCRQINKSCADL